MKLSRRSLLALIPAALLKPKASATQWLVPEVACTKDELFATYAAHYCELRDSQSGIHPVMYGVHADARERLGFNDPRNRKFLDDVAK